MGVRRIVFLAGLTAAAVAVRRHVLAHGPQRDGQAAMPGHGGAGAHGGVGGVVHGGWATCSAPNARWYDVAAGALLGGLYRRMADDLAAAAAGIRAPEVLEVGPGPGNLAIELARRVPDLRLTGVDIDPEMVERAVARAGRDRMQDRVTFRVGDVATLPFPDASFDLVTSSFSVHHWPAAAAGFAEIRRVLRPGGRAIVYDLGDIWGRVERGARPLSEVATAGGFADAATTPFRWPGAIALTNRLEVVRAPDPEAPDLEPAMAAPEPPTVEPEPAAT